MFRALRPLAFDQFTIERQTEASAIGPQRDRRKAADEGDAYSAIV
jgi:hypothetical protein